MPGRKNYCICGGQKWEKIRGRRRLMPCFWRIQVSGAPVGTGPLGDLHPQCLLAIGLFGLFDTATQTRFENGFRDFLQKRTRRYLLLQSLYDTIPSPATTRPNKDADFNPTRYTSNGTPQYFPNGIMQIILTACKRICSTTTLADLDGGRTFNGTLWGLWNTIHQEDDHPFIDEMRGLSLAARTVAREGHAIFYDSHQAEEYYAERRPELSSTRKKGKRRRIRHEIGQFVANSYEASTEVFQEGNILMTNPNNGKTQGAKAHAQKLFRIDENWTPREGKYNSVLEGRLTTQVRGGLIVSEAIIQRGQHYAMSFTLTHPLGPGWKKVNGHQGILVSATTLKERGGMFQDREMKKLDTHVWQLVCFEGGVNHIRTKHWGQLTPIPEGTEIFVALTHPESVYYTNLVSFGTPRRGFAPNHAMFALHANGPFVIPNWWVKFVYHRNTAPIFKLLPYTQPNVSGADLDDLVLS